MLKTLKQASRGRKGEPEGEPAGERGGRASSSFFVRATFSVNGCSCRSNSAKNLTTVTGRHYFNREDLKKKSDHASWKIHLPLSK